MGGELTQSEREEQPVEECSFCRAAMPNGPFWNRPLLETNNFIVLPSLGAIVPGWLLIVSKRHFISAAHIPQSLADEMNCLKDHLRARLAAEFRHPWVFEHGPAIERRPVGCGVDHAHLHVVPIELDLVQAIGPYLPKGAHFRSGTLADCREGVLVGLDYLYAEPPGEGGLVAFSTDFSGQLFRKAVASLYSKQHQYDWRTHPHLENVTATAKRFARHTDDFLELDQVKLATA